MHQLVQSFSELTPNRQSSAGGKGGALARLFQAGLPVPDGFVILPNAFVDTGSVGGELTAEAWTQIQMQLTQLRGQNGKTAFAVRSSAMSEDSAQASFAGEFESVLNVQSDEDVRKAIHTVYHSRQNERVKAYSRAQGMSEVHEIAVIVQQLVAAESSGVLFTANPVTGQREQAMISAAWGLGEAIVGGLVTPDTLMVEKATGRVLSRETADKQVMTVRLGSNTEEQTAPETLRHAPVLSDEEAAELVQLGHQIEKLYGIPVDIEWTLADGEFAIIQARPITALPEAEPPVPTEWPLPDGAYSLMRNNIVELMADPLTPLFSTLGLSAVNASMERLLTAFFGKPGIMPGELIVTVNEYAYYNGSVSLGSLGKILLGSGSILRRMFTGAVERWTDVGRPHYVATVERWQNEEWRDRPATEILHAVRELSEAAIDAYGALVSGVIPAAWISEGLFTLVNKLVKRRDDPKAPVYLLGFDSLPIRAEKSLYDLAEWTNAHAELAAYLRETPVAQLVSRFQSHSLEEQSSLSMPADDWRAWQDRVQEHLQEYGHTIYNLDFASPVPADDPAPLLQTFKLFLSRQGMNPYERQKTAADRREQATQAMEKRLTGLRLKRFRKERVRAQRYAPLREDGLADVGLSYPLLRQMLHELGHRFAENDLIEQPDDIFWLEQAEVARAATRLDAGEPLENLSATIPKRKAKWRAAKRATPPRMLPQLKFFGIDLLEIRSRRTQRRGGETLKGVAASPGTVTAPASVIHGPEDFAQMATGDVLVAPLTTPAWTPLFARAAAIVTDIGGPLSHGSIVAREYGIPAVLGTNIATKRIRSGQVITVDGSAGVVTISKQDESGTTFD